eukprot:m.232074 g.232074  ORF g.232074 m.232074 type:complete len:267 (-) comp22436_c12_seq4:56-856(-)
MEAAFAGFTGGKAEMDGVKFTKLCKDAGIVSKQFTTTDVDIIFAKCHAKGARKITFPEFQQAIELIATAKKSTVDAVEAAISAATPKIKGTAADSGGIVDRLTDASKYTGAHKERFDAAGKGKGLEGRDSTAKGKGALPTKGLSSGGTPDLSAITDRSAADVRGVKAASTTTTTTGRGERKRKEKQDPTGWWRAGTAAAGEGGEGGGGGTGWQWPGQHHRKEGAKEQQAIRQQPVDASGEKQQESTQCSRSEECSNNHTRHALPCC